MKTFIKKHPVIAILRGVIPSEVVEIAQCLYTQGIRVIEVPLNSPQALESIARLVMTLPKDCLVGAGTVLSLEQIKQVENIGAKLIFSPHCDPELIEYCTVNNLYVVPGIATATEALSAYKAGARWLKIFPAQTYGFTHIRALKSVLPNDVHIIPVGGVSQSNALQWLTSDASALGIGNSLYQRNDTLDMVKNKAILLNDTLNAIKINNDQ
ncbi:2-dehydro-3-deoxy-6-phosphogalactonate aldolase [Colwellia sp. C1TZA3]|uniref:2-dehydro-3-deoxy-6-phosphogalactonate aldolase n=1 Tax=Colwellia sp. C1TZA3 TaxID=2508879 RepID=UPI0011B96ECA|nr:2-dehydro-3-deoxy-6-phosphogalactonate aldolase [Colwellia sp. C1TZA3]TWX72457.1 bifunctional 4-hydroxy-2-oxoglutarate aldolase/2-dehydro-3-deoxy-phosphogluconate aldolase [Colwellia sp. C1TZA3]